MPVPVAQRKGPAKTFSADEYIKGATTEESLKRLRPAFLQGGTVTAGEQGARTGLRIGWSHFERAAMESGAGPASLRAGGFVLWIPVRLATICHASPRFWSQRQTVLI